MYAFSGLSSVWVLAIAHMAGLGAIVFLNIAVLHKFKRCFKLVPGYENEEKQLEEEANSSDSDRRVNLAMDKIQKDDQERDIALF